VTILRGSLVNPWDLRPWESLGDEYDVSVLVPRRNQYQTSGIRLEQRDVRTMRDVLPGGLVGRFALKGVGDRYFDLESRLRGVNLVHAAELGFWFTWQAARLRERLGFRLVITVWETIPFVDAFRNIRTRRYRREVIPQVDMFLPTTERAADALLLEGADPQRIRVCPPGIDVDRFGKGRDANPPADGSHLILSAGRLVWEKGHQDVVRALALLRHRGRRDVRLLVIGAGPEEARLRRVASDLGVADAVELRGSVPYDEMPSIYAAASGMVLASIPTPFWEEQFGMVLAEAMAAGLPIITTRSGAIPEVVGDDADLIAPGDWRGLADALERGSLSGPPGARRSADPERVERFSSRAAAARLRAVYDEMLAAG
jgi:glycosyltransferase involved in cell wall biosynthesis